MLIAHLAGRQWAAPSLNRTPKPAARWCCLGRPWWTSSSGSNADPTGQSVRIQKVPFQIIGVLARKGQSATGQDYDDAASFRTPPFSQDQGGLQKSSAGALMVSAVSSEATTRAQNQIAPCCAIATTLHWRRPTTSAFESDRDGHAPSKRRQDVDHPSGQHRRGVAHRGGNRHHEHHARPVSPSAHARSASAWLWARGRADVLSQFLVEALALSIAEASSHPAGACWPNRLAANLVGPF